MPIVVNQKVIGLWSNPNKSREANECASAFPTWAKRHRTLLLHFLHSALPFIWVSRKQELTVYCVALASGHRRTKVLKIRNVFMLDMVKLIIIKYTKLSLSLSLLPSSHLMVRVWSPLNHVVWKIPSMQEMEKKGGFFLVGSTVDFSMSDCCGCELWSPHFLSFYSLSHVGSPRSYC